MDTCGDYFSVVMKGKHNDRLTIKCLTKSMHARLNDGTLMVSRNLVLKNETHNHPTEMSHLVSVANGEP